MVEETFSVAFIGGGNMAMSLVKGLIGKGQTAITVADPAAEQRVRYEALNVTAVADNDAACRAADVVVIAVKPQVARDVVSTLELRPDQLLISIAAGITCESLESWTSREQPIVRCMPNTPALLGAGMSALYATTRVDGAQRTAAEQILSAVGDALWVDEESTLDAVTAVSGSGPAYFFLLMESMIDTGVTLGLDRDTATRLAAQTAYGAARMALESGDDPATLRRNVTSPGGTTQAAIAVMETNGLPATVAEALEACARRSLEMAEEFK